MHIGKIIVSILAASSVCSAAISGKVTDTSGAAIPGAVVSLEKGGQPDTTDADGSFSVTANAGIGGWSHHSPRHFSVALQGGLLRVVVAARSVVEIAAFDLRGKAFSVRRRLLDAGTHIMAPPGGGAGVLVYRIKAGGAAFFLKGTGVNGTVPRFANRESIGMEAPAKRATPAGPLDDALAVTKDGYLTYRVIVTNSDTSGIEIKMTGCAGTVTDADGNVYQTVKLGNQVWTVENLRAAKYNDGTAIPHVPGDAWGTLTTPGYCYYDNTTDADSIRKYGALYNWYAVNTKKLAPAGWHVPTDPEWEELQNHLTANGYNWDGTTSSPWNKLAKSLAARTDWQASTDSGAIGNDIRKNNRSGFSALPGGCRLISGMFFFIGTAGSWWTATEYDPPYGYLRLLLHDKEKLDRNYLFESSGFSVRIVKD